ncbi:MAG: hypothetical protein IRY99_10465 [Isosphaeraceae bacterium]|nr:hypothetical protein [Isosphaeraceae bacterium]
MVHYIAEDPTFLAGALGAAAVVCLVLLKLTQQGKYLIWAGATLALAVSLVIVERFWVTDAERIEAVVYDLVRAVEASDADRAADCLAPDARIELGSPTLEGNIYLKYILGVVGRFQGLRLTRALLRDELERLQFDSIRVTRLTVNAYSQSRRGTAEFRVYAMGTHETPSGHFNFATPASGSDWSLGLREVEPGIWKVDRISPTALPIGPDVPPKGAGRPRRR